MRSWLVGLALLTVLAGCGTATTSHGSSTSLGSATEGDLRLSGGWVAAGTRASSAAYFVLTDTGPDDAVVGASTSAAGAVEIHRTRRSADGSGETMSQAARLAVTRDGPLRLRPGGSHLMLVDLPRPLHAGQHVDLALRFADGRSMTVWMPVISSVDRPQ